MIGDALNTAQSISNFGMLAVTAGFFLVLSNEMASSDAHAAKCIKLGLNFGEAYPEELERYKASRDEYNANEVALSELYAALEKEAQADAADLTIEQIP